MDEEVFKDILAQETEASEQSREVAPDGKGVRRNRTSNRTVVFSVRLNTDEVESLQALADRDGLPSSTLVRSWIVERIRREEGKSTVPDFSYADLTLDGEGLTSGPTDDRSAFVRSIVREELRDLLEGIRQEGPNARASG